MIGNYDLTIVDNLAPESRMAIRRGSVVGWQIDYDLVYKHRQLDFGIKFRDNFIETDKQKSHKSIVTFYWPRQFSYMRTMSDRNGILKGEIVEWAKSFNTFEDYELQLIKDVCDSSDLTYGYVFDRERRKLVTKFILATYFWDDVTENLYESDVPYAQELAEIYLDNTRRIVTGEEALKIDYGLYSENFPRDVARIIVVEKIYAEIRDLVKSLLAPNVAQMFFDLNGRTWDAGRRELQIVKDRKLTNGEYASHDEYCSIRPFYCLYPSIFALTLDEDDVPYYQLGGTIFQMSSLQCALDNDWISFAKEQKYHAPFNYAQRMYSLECDRNIFETFKAFGQHRDNVMRSMEITWANLEPRRRTKLFKNFYFLTGITLLQFESRRYGWTW